MSEFGPMENMRLTRLIRKINVWIYFAHEKLTTISHNKVQLRKRLHSTKYWHLFLYVPFSNLTYSETGHGVCDSLAVLIFLSPSQYSLPPCQSRHASDLGLVGGFSKVLHFPPPF